MRIRSALSVLAVVGAVLLGACSDDDAADADSPTSSGAVGGLIDPRPSAIESYAELGGSIVELRFYAGVEACYGLDRVDVVDGEAEVTVTVHVGSRPGEMACIDIAESVATRVDLGAPLAGRALVDGSTGQPIGVD